MIYVFCVNSDFNDFNCVNESSEQWSGPRLPIHNLREVTDSHKSYTEATRTDKLCHTRARGVQPRCSSPFIGP